MNATVTRNAARLAVTAAGMALASVAVLPTSPAHAVRVNNLANLEATTTTSVVQGVNTAGTVRVKVEA